jgi:flagellar hook-associated protein 2
VDPVTVGRNTVDITASDDGGQLALLHGDYGSTRGFEVSFAAGGTDGTASLGLTAGTYAGTDVMGTMGGHAATGDGQRLTGDEGTPVDGLMILYKGADTGTAGAITFSRGIGSVLERLTGDLLKTGPGTISGIVERMDANVQRINDRIDDIEFRLEKRRADLIKRFAKMEEALTRAQQQSSWLAAQFGLMSSSASSSK